MHRLPTGHLTKYPPHLHIYLWLYGLCCAAHPTYLLLHSTTSIRRKHYIESISISPRHHRFRPSAIIKSPRHTPTGDGRGAKRTWLPLSSALAGPTEEETARPAPRVQVVEPACPALRCAALR